MFARFIKYIKTQFYDNVDNMVLWPPIFFICGIYVFFKLEYYNALFPLFALFIISLLFLLYKKFQNYLFLILLVLIFFFSLGYIRSYYYSQKFDYPIIEYNLGQVLVHGYLEKVELKKSYKNVLFKELLVNVEKIEPTENSSLQFKEKYKNFKIPKKLTIRINDINTIVEEGNVIIQSYIYPISKKIHLTSFDFERYYYFKYVGGNGFKGEILKNIPAVKKKSLLEKIDNFRYEFALKITSEIDKPSAGIVATLLTGNKKLADQEAIEDMNYSGLAHLLSISGMHMITLIMMTTFLIKWLLSRSEKFILKYNIFKISAIVSLIINFFYLALSGFSVSATRAYIMSVVVLFSIILEKFNCALRAVIFTCLAIAFVQPDSIFNPGFQMSFSAVICLISGYIYYNEKKEDKNSLAYRLSQYKITKFISAILLSSIIAEISTTPFSLYHFNNYTFYNVFANFIAVPLTTMFILPLSMLALPLYFFDLEKIVLIPTCYATDIILWISNYITSIENSIVFLPSPNSISMFLMIFGGLWFCLWKTNWRKFGFILYILGVMVIFFQPKPDLIIDYNKNSIVITDNDYNLYSVGYKNDFNMKILAHKLGKNNYFELKDFYKLQCKENCPYFKILKNKYAYYKNNKKIIIQRKNKKLKLIPYNIKKIKSINNIDFIYVEKGKKNL